MWASGAFRWDAAAPLHLGDEAIARAKVTKVEKKGFDEGKSPMVFVHQNIKYRAKNAVLDSFEEDRIHVYLPLHARADNRLPREGKYLLVFQNVLLRVNRDELCFHSEGPC